MLVLRDAHPGDPPLDIAVSHALLQRVAAGEQPATVRLYRPGPTLAFGRLYELAAGFGAACAAGRDRGFTPLRRLAGGRAAAYDEGSLIYEEIVPTGAGLQEMTVRFDAATALLASALVVARRRARRPDPRRVLPWAPQHHACGRLEGRRRGPAGGARRRAAQRGDRGRPRRPRADVLVDAYRALDVPLTPSTAGALDDVVAGVTTDALADALLQALWDGGHTTAPGAVDEPTLAAARGLRERHAIG